MRDDETADKENVVPTGLKPKPYKGNRKSTMQFNPNMKLDPSQIIDLRRVHGPKGRQPNPMPNRPPRPMPEHLRAALAKRAAKG